MAATFLLLEILDPAVNAFLWQIRDILSYPHGKRRRVRTPIHVTVRGPYENEIPREAIMAAAKAIQHDVVRISRPGRFSNPDEEILFLRVDSPNLRTIWWKPDYPIEKHGFTPHISLYKGTDAAFADLIFEFLRAERIEFLVAEHRLTPLRAGQPDLLTSRAPTIDDEIKMFQTSNIDTALLDRLTELRDRYLFATSDDVVRSSAVTVPQEAKPRPVRRRVQSKRK